MHPRTLLFALGLTSGLFGSFAGCSEDPETYGTDDWIIAFDDADSDALPADEIAARDEFIATPVNVRGQVLGPTGAPVADATIRMGAVYTTTTRQGRFTLSGLRRHNRVLEVDAPGYRKEFIFPQLVTPVSVDAVELATTWLTPVDATTSRFLFAGDVALGRRFLDPENLTPRGMTPPDDPLALILASMPVPGSQSVVQFVKPLFAEADYRVVNLESVVTDNPATPHPTKAFCFFTLPASLVALTDLGVQYVGLGNNHLYDYEALGVADTRANLDRIGIGYSGAGNDPTQAFAPYRTEIVGQPYSLLAMTSVSGVEHAIHYVADATQGGAADLRDEAMVAGTIAAEKAAGRRVIAMLHQGREYTFEPSADSILRLNQVTQAGADVVIAHHPHVAQGFGFSGATLQVHSLGNFAFDSDRAETLWSLLARIDMQGGNLVQTTALPIYIEDYRPRPMTTASSDVFLRRIAEFSNRYAAFARSDGSFLRVTANADAWRDQDTTQTITVEVDADGHTVLDLRGLQPAGSALHRAVVDGAAQLWSGRDLLQFGDFEDADVDGDTLELARWDVTGSYSFACLADKVRGAAALCLRGKATQSSSTAVALRNRIRVMGDADDTPNKNLTLFGYSRMQNSGPVTIRADYSPSEGSDDLGSEVAYNNPGGTSAWAPFESDLHMPADTVPSGPTINARAVRIFLKQLPPMMGESMLMFDDLAIIGWEAQVDGTGATPLVTPHARDFLRIVAAPGRYQVTLTFRAAVRAEAP